MTNTDQTLFDALMPGVHRRKSTLPVVLARFVSGRPLDGIPRSNSTWTRPGTRVVGQPHRDRPTKWMALPGWKRSAWRLGITTPMLGNAVGLFVQPALTLAADGCLTTALSAWGTYKANQAIRTRAHRKTWINPLHEVLRPALGWDSSVLPEDYLQVPANIHTDPDVQMVVRLPAGFEGDAATKDRVASIIRTKMALEDATLNWKLAGATPHLIVKQAPKCPTRVDWAQVLPLIEAASESAPLIGLGKRDKVIAVNLDSDSPHILLSITTGGGKSVFARTMAAQILARGGRVVICDIKKVSHRWARGLPGVTYARTPEEIHDAIIMVAQEGEHRFAMIDQDRDEEVAALPRVLLIMEEMNATMGKLQDHWAAVREKDDPKKSPAISAFGDVLFMGRQARTHVLGIGQLGTARAFGGPEMRECFSARVLARYSQNAWKMLVPEVWPMPRKVKIDGRMQLVQDGTAQETQVVFGTEAEVREFVLARRPRLVPVSHDATESRYQENAGSTVAAPPVGQAPALRLVKSPENNPIPVDPNAPISLREFAKMGLVRLSDTPEKSLAILRAARGRDPEFPLPVAESGGKKLYLPSELIRWARNRPKATG